MSALDQAIRAEALSWQATPFRHGAAIRGIGVDCIHLVHAVLSAVGLIDAEVPFYPPDWHLHHDRERLIEGLEAAGFVRVELPYEVGDVFVYRYGRAASHCGLYVGDGRIVHAATRDQVRCDLIASSSLTRRFVAAYRVAR